MSDLEADRPESLRTEIEVLTTLEEIPGGIVCQACGMPTSKQFVAFEIQVSNRIFHTPLAAGYFCEEDRLVSISHEALLEFLHNALRMVTTEGDMTVAQELERRIAFQKQAMEESRRLEEEIASDSGNQ